MPVTEINSAPDSTLENRRWFSWKRLMPIIVLLVATLAAGASFFPVAADPAPVRKVQMVKAYPHDPGAFCQGLVVHNGQLLEGTGQYNESRLRLVNIDTGVPLIQVALANNVFGEGVTVWENTILQLTWKNGYLITYDATTFQEQRKIALKTIDRTLYEGWGITHNGTYLIISDGSATLRFVDPKTFRLAFSLRVKDGQTPVKKLNELEFVDGEIFANVWYKDQIARIDPATGQVTGWLDVSSLRPRSVQNNREAALNGIAWDAANRRLFVTGKNWPNVFEVSF